MWPGSIANSPRGFRTTNVRVDSPQRTGGQARLAKRRNSSLATGSNSGDATGTVGAAGCQHLDPLRTFDQRLDTSASVKGYRQGTSHWPLSGYWSYESVHGAWRSPEAVDVDQRDEIKYRAREIELERPFSITLDAAACIGLHLLGFPGSKVSCAAPHRHNSSAHPTSARCCQHVQNMG